MDSRLLVIAQDGGLTDTVTDRQTDSPWRNQSGFQEQLRFPPINRVGRLRFAQAHGYASPFPSPSSNCSVGRLLVGTVQRLTVTTLVGYLPSLCSLAASTYSLEKCLFKTFWPFFKKVYFIIDTTLNSRTRPEQLILPYAHVFQVRLGLEPCH